MTEKETTATNPSAGEEVKNEAEPDFELLAFQKQRSTPRFSLSQIKEGEDEKVLVEVDDFGQVEDTTEHMGMLSEGQEQKIVDQLRRAGSLENVTPETTTTDSNQQQAASTTSTTAP